MLKLVALAVAGAVGTLARYWLSGSVHRYSKTTFPSGTLVVNIAGCLLIGLISYLFTEYAFFGPDTRAVVFVGFVGGFTTFSAFGFETLELFRTGSFVLAGINILGNVIGGLVAVWLGAAAGRVLGP